MQIIIHRGTHQIGGVATEIRTNNTRIVIDMGEELSMDENFVSSPLSIPGVTDEHGMCDAVLFTHNHGDHIGQLKNIKEDVPLYIGALAKEIYLITQKDTNLFERIKKANSFTPGVKFKIGEIEITPYSIDHSACDSYMFLIEADGKRILHSGDFRMHGFRGKGVLKILDKLIRKVDILIVEGTNLLRSSKIMMTEQELQQKAREYMNRYKYVYVLCASTNLERICALSKAVPKGKYFICDKYQSNLIELLQSHWEQFSPLYREIKKTVYNENILPRFQKRGFLMMVRDNQRFREIIRKFDSEQGIILYSMWDGYRTKLNSTIPDFLKLTKNWDTLHTSGHASANDIQIMIERIKPSVIIPIHTECPEELQKACPEQNVIILKDAEPLDV